MTAPIGVIESNYSYFGKDYVIEEYATPPLSICKYMHTDLSVNMCIGTVLDMPSSFLQNWSKYFSQYVTGSAGHTAMPVVSAAVKAFAKVRDMGIDSSYSYNFAKDGTLYDIVNGETGGNVLDDYVNTEVITLGGPAIGFYVDGKAYLIRGK